MDRVPFSIRDGGAGSLVRLFCSKEVSSATGDQKRKEWNLGVIILRLKALMGR